MSSLVLIQEYFLRKATRQGMKVDDRTRVNLVG